MDTSFTPVPYEFRELIQDEIDNQRSGKVFFFSGKRKLDCTEGTVIKLEEIAGKGWFITMHPHAVIRIDLIVTLFGRPGAAFDEYDAYGRTCMECDWDQD